MNEKFEKIQESTRHNKEAISCDEKLFIDFPGEIFSLKNLICCFLTEEAMFLWKNVFFEITHNSLIVSDHS